MHSTRARQPLHHRGDQYYQEESTFMTISLQDHYKYLLHETFLSVIKARSLLQLIYYLFFQVSIQLNMKISLDNSKTDKSFSCTLNGR